MKSNVFIQKHLASEKCLTESKYANVSGSEHALMNLAQVCGTKYGDVQPPKTYTRREAPIN